MRAALLVPLLLAGCAQPPQPAPKPKVSPCGVPAFTIAAQAPGELRARLNIKRRGEGMGADAFRTCLVVGEQTRLFERDEHDVVDIAAHPTEIQRLVVDGETVLVSIPPGYEIFVRDHPCFFWSINSEWLDPWFLPEPIARCRAEGEPCPRFYARAGPPGPVEDGLCGSSELRCIEQARVRLYVRVTQS